jgi:hypothetical protein
MIQSYCLRRQCTYSWNLEVGRVEDWYIGELFAPDCF